MVCGEVWGVWGGGRHGEIMGRLLSDYGETFAAGRGRLWGDCGETVGRCGEVAACIAARPSSRCSGAKRSLSASEKERGQHQM